VRDLLDRESLTAVKRYETKRVYIINQTLPNAKTINLKGKVFIEPKTKDLSIICDHIIPLENQAESFKITDDFKENSRKYFNSGDNIYKQINPDIVGKQREIAKQSLILQLHSPCKIFDITRKKLIRGGLNIIFYGDTKCGKSEIAKDVTQKGSMPLGEYTICETGGRTGFLYTIDKDKGSLIWGSLALNDMGLVILDGLQSMHSEELGEFREAIEQQEICGLRIIIIFTDSHDAAHSQSRKMRLSN
jgi:DNA replicative helicase MCM subunit Mcm2 (Cdc46/Mcm family)